MAKYTKEETDKLVELYQEKGNDGLDEIAETLGKARRSVIAKLTREGVYVKPVKETPEPKQEGPTKAELMTEMVAAGFDTEGGQNATRDFLMRVRDVVTRNAA